MRTKDTYKEVRVVEMPGMVARVHFPDISAEERKRRMNIIHNAAANLLKERKNVLQNG